MTIFSRVLVAAFVDKKVKYEARSDNMAGAGPNVERLLMVVVPPMLSEGGRFLKWDDVCELYFLTLLGLLRYFRVATS